MSVIIMFICFKTTTNIYCTGMVLRELCYNVKPFLVFDILRTETISSDTGSHKSEYGVVFEGLSIQCGASEVQMVYSTSKIA